MSDINNKTTRLQIIKKYLRAETTLEEEKDLFHYLQNPKEQLSLEEMMIQSLFTATHRCEKEDTLSQSKADEFDRLMNRTSKKVAKQKHRKANFLYWMSSAAAAFILVWLIITIEKKQTPVADQTSIHKKNTAPTSIEEKKTVAHHEISEVPSSEKKEEPAIGQPQKTLVKTKEKHVIKSKQKAILAHRRHEKTTPPTNTHSASEKQEANTPHTDLRQQISDIMQASNILQEQTETYEIHKAGDANIVTRHMPDGTSSSYIIMASDDNETYHVVPLKIDL